MTGQVLGWAAFAVVLVVLYLVAYRPTVPAHKPRHWSLDRRPDGLPRDSGERAVVSMHPARAAAWLVIATALAVLLFLGAGFAAVVRLLRHPFRRHQGETHGPVPRDGEPLTTWEAGRWGWVTVLYQEDADDPQRGGGRVRGRKR